MIVTAKKNLNDKALKRAIGKAKYYSLLSGFEVKIEDSIVKKFSHCFILPAKGVKKNGDNE